jgi:hypothetical protein
MWGELIVLLIGIIIMLMMIRRNAPTDEPFEDAPTLLACPSSYKIVHSSDGSTVCCDGDVVSNQCISSHPCLLNGTKSNMPSCASVLQAEYKEKSSQCPPSMPSYFEDGKKKGCTKGPLNGTMTGPKLDTQPKCVIYSTTDSNVNAVDSCMNQKDLEETTCFGNQCTTSLIQNQPNTPVLVSISFTDPSGIHRVAYTRKSMERSMDATKPNWRDSGMDMSKNIAIAEVAKAFYIDQTLQQSDVQL